MQTSNDVQFGHQEWSVWLIYLSLKPRLCIQYCMPNSGRWHCMREMVAWSLPTVAHVHSPMIILHRIRLSATRKTFKSFCRFHSSLSSNSHSFRFKNKRTFSISFWKSMNLELLTVQEIGNSDGLLISWLRSQKFKTLWSLLLDWD